MSLQPRLVSCKSRLWLPHQTKSLSPPPQSTLQLKNYLLKDKIISYVGALISWDKIKNQFVKYNQFTCLSHMPGSYNDEVWSCHGSHFCKLHAQKREITPQQFTTQILTTVIFSLSFLNNAYSITHNFNNNKAILAAMH